MEPHTFREHDPDCNPNNYAVSFPDSHWSGGHIVTMPLVHKANTVRIHLELVLEEAKLAVTSGAELPALMTGLAAVDYLVGFTVGRSTTRQDYLRYIKSYFPTVYEPISAWIYDHLRCGLLHNLVAMNPWRSEIPNRPFRLTAEPTLHLETDSDGKLVFVIPAFLEDINKSWVRYRHELLPPVSKAELVEKFHQRFNRLEGAGAFMTRE